MRNALRTLGLGLLPALSLTLVLSSLAWAISGGTNIDTTNGVISLTGQVAVANGGTGQSSVTTDEVLVGTSGGAFTKTALVSCSDTSDALQYNTSTQSFACKEDVGGSAVYPEISFNSETVLDQNGDTLYLGVGGKVSATKANVVVPIGAGTLANLRCRASGTVGGTSLTATLYEGTCGSEASTSLAVAITGTAVTSDTSNTATISAGECIVLDLTAVGDTNAVHVSCSLQKTSN
jgi:hypothetical protein